MSDMVITAQGLTKFFRRKCAVDGISFGVPRGSVTAFLGRNGSGKTTTLRMLLGLLEPTRGSSTILGHDSQKIPAALRGTIGYLAEGHPLIPWMTVRQAAQFQSLMYNIGDKLSIQPGFRYAYNTKFNAPPVPSINIKWNAVSYLNIRASYVRGYRAPSLKELYIQFKDINHDIQPNENLKAENGNNFDLSFNFNTDKASKIHFTNIELSLFYNQMSNIIYLAPIEGESSTSYKYINISNYNTLGSQVSFRYSFYPNFDFGFGVGNTGIIASFDKKNQSLSKYKFATDASLNISYLIPKANIKISTNYKYSGLSQNVFLNSNDQIQYGTLNDYHTLDISLIRKFLSNKLTVSFGVKNLFNNTLIANKGVIGDTPHSSSDGSPVGYGRLVFTAISYNIFK